MGLLIIRFTLLMLRQQNGQAFSLVRFVFRYLIKGIRTRALRKRHSALFLAADRRLLQSIKIANQGCFAKGKNESLSYALNRDSARCVESCLLRREPLRRKADAPLLRVNSPASLLHEPFLSSKNLKVKNSKTSILAKISNVLFNPCKIYWSVASIVIKWVFVDFFTMVQIVL